MKDILYYIKTNYLQHIPCYITTYTMYRSLRSEKLTSYNILL